jgi:hypothetical protein
MGICGEASGEETPLQELGVGERIILK